MQYISQPITSSLTSDSEEKKLVSLFRATVKRLRKYIAYRYQQGGKKDSDNENDRNNGLRMKKEMTMTEKRFSFFADQQERKAESLPSFGTLPFARHMSLRFANVKEPNLTYTQINRI